VDGVRRAIAFAEPNALIGQIVSVKFAVERHCRVEDVQARLERHLRKSLRKEAWPRRWIVDEVGMANNSKRVTH
jgi:hypothetical protein